MESTNKQNKDFIIKIIFVDILFMITYKLSLTFFEPDIPEDLVDFIYHSRMAEEFNLKTYIENGNIRFMWRALVALLYRSGNVPLQDACATITALANATTLYIVLDYIKKKIPKIDNIFWIYFGTGALLAGPLFFPWINSYYYVGTWSPNTWHNPTNIMVKPFAILSVILILNILDSKETNLKDHIFLAVILALSMFAKPSFMQGIAPALALYVMIELVFTRKLFLRKYLLLAATFAPSICIMLFQTYQTFYSSTTKSGGIGIEFLRVLNYYDVNAWVAFLACTAFPLFVIITAIIIQKKNVLQNSRIILTICYLISGWSEMALLYEKGIRELHCNFAWGYMLAVFVAFVLAVIEFLNILVSNIKYKEIIKNIGIILFSCHLLLGCGYINRLVQYHLLY